MRTITLNKMRIENFKGIQNLEISFNGKNTLISGFNGTGKSTIEDAYFWATTGKNAALAARFEVRPRDKQGNEVHDVITSVECEFTVFENLCEPFTFTIRRDEIEDLTEKAKQQLKPETIAPKKSFYFIDNAPYDAKIFYAKLGEIMCDKDKFTILSNPMAFFALDEKVQRDLLTAACGDVQDSEVENYEQVKQICGAINTPAQVKEGLADNIRKAKKRLDEIPAQIKVLAPNCDEYADYAKQIADLERQRAEVEEKGKIIKSKLYDLQKANENKPIKPSDHNLWIAQASLDSATKELERTRITLNAELERQEKNKCPNCGFALADITAHIDEIKNNISKLESECAEWESKVAYEKAEYEKAMKEYLDSLTPEVDTTQEREAIENRIAELRAKYIDLSVEIERLHTAQKVQSQIKALRDEQRKLDDQLAGDMTKFDIISAFLNKKAEKVVENINDRFTTVQFKLFEMQANGELKTCCKAMVNGVSYANINTAAKVQVGVEIAKLFSEFYGVRAPIWVDDKESVLELPPIDTQLVCLKVKETPFILPNRDDFETDDDYEKAVEKAKANYEKAKKELHIEAV
ncbi:MAG: AAA family ATPase [Eubacterium sp.]|nr:AAA family ATPase [Eubacterium sp.]